ncbi:hypothetical protein ACFU1Q_00035 [Brachybacterium paraconglomeratum]
MQRFLSGYGRRRQRRSLRDGRVEVQGDVEGGGVAHIVGVRREGGPEDGDALVIKDALATEPLIALAAWVVLGNVFFVQRKPTVDEMPDKELEQVILEG